MAKKLNPDNLIDVEIKKFEAKLAEFQNYMQMNTIVTQVTDGDKILLTEENQDLLHEEILIQIKMQDAVLSWMPLLKKLRETEKEKVDENRGDIEVGGNFKKG